MLYLTSKYSTLAPIDDPNAVILVDYYVFFGNDHIEFLKTASGEVIGMMTVAGTDASQSGSTYMAKNADGPVAAAASSPGSGRHVTIWDMPEDASSRYTGETTYKSWSVVGGATFMPAGDPVLLDWKAVALMTASGANEVVTLVDQF